MPPQIKDSLRLGVIGCMARMLALEEALHPPAPLRRTQVRKVRAATHFVTLAVVTGLTTGTLVVFAALIGSL